MPRYVHASTERLLYLSVIPSHCKKKGVKCSYLHNMKQASKSGRLGTSVLASASGTAVIGGSFFGVAGAVMGAIIGAALGVVTATGETPNSTSGGSSFRPKNDTSERLADKRKRAKDASKMVEC
jgi:hypothetical protein